MLERIARFSFRRRWLVLALWFVAIVTTGAVSSSLGTAEDAGFNLPDTESRAVLDMLEEAAPDRAGESAQVVFKALEGSLTDPANRAVIEAAVVEMQSVDDAPTVVSPFSPEGARQITADGRIAYVDLRFSDMNARAEMPPAAAAIEDIAVGLRSDALQVELGGDLFVDFSPPESEIFGLVAAVFILLLSFGSVLAVGLPIGVALVGVATGVAVIGIAGHLVEMPDFTITLALMIGIGVGIDYALFIVTRYREALLAGEEPEDAAVTSISTAGRAVLFAGTIVIISLLGMLLMGVPFIRGLGIGAALAVLATMIASLTFLPALLGFVQRRIDFTTWYAVIGLVVFNVGFLGFALTKSPAVFGVGVLAAIAIAVVGRFAVPALRKQAPIPQPDDSADNMWHRWSRVVQRHPWVSAISGTLVLAVLALPLFGMRLGNSDNGNLPAEQTARKAYDLMAEGFGPGFNGPLLLAMRTPAGTTPEQVGAVSVLLSETEGVQAASPGFSPPGSDVTLWQVVPTTGPQDEGTTQLIDRLRDEVLPTTDLPIMVGGPTAIFADFSDFLASRLPVFMAAVLILSFLLLMAVFRSILVPLKAVLLNLLSIGAAYGVVVAVFQWGWFGSVLGIGPGPIESFIPMMLFAIVFGLSMDYEVFLLSRMREEYLRTGDNSASVADGLAVTARVITAAAAIMVFVFGSFLLEDLRQIKLFGLGLAVAVFLDATIVRMLLVPATMELLGDRNWWLPGWLDRILPTIDVEGHARTAHTSGDRTDDDATPATDSRDDDPVPVG